MSHVRERPDSDKHIKALIVMNVTLTLSPLT